ncbi:hypothetical protein A9G22_05060 [Gilliamella sp. App2-1]|uniref:hypothetical protein n=1 Tax=Gilliamella sp. App2-1 TaxID=3120230 RepID=UPI0008294285|nr:hypothetical protein [Gilliamella apicola]OCG24129.1 hypothetical protein A9G22_05060 [Gilliamella apicola]
MIAKLDSRSLMQLSDGTIPLDKYFASRIYPWSINSNQSLVDKVRKASLNEILTQICEMSPSGKNKIRSVITLSSVRYTFHNVWGSIGYKEKMQLTDYSTDSIKRFRFYLISKYKTNNKLNDKLTLNFNFFDEIASLSKNIMKDDLNKFFEPLNYDSSGKLTLYSWADLGKNKSSKIKIYADIGFNMMVVYQAIPTLETSVVRYRYYLDFRNMSHGIYSVDRPVQFSVENKILFWYVYPRSLTAVYYNPFSEDFYNSKENEVKSEISDYADIVRASCIGKEKTFSHQIEPV